MKMIKGIIDRVEDDELVEQPIYLNPVYIQSIQRDGSYYVIKMHDGTSHDLIKEFREVDIESGGGDIDDDWNSETDI